MNCSTQFLCVVHPELPYLSIRSTVVCDQAIFAPYYQTYHRESVLFIGTRFSNLYTASLSGVVTVFFS
jgi:hypothetical protein